MEYWIQFFHVYTSDIVIIRLINNTRRVVIFVKGRRFDVATLECQINVPPHVNWIFSNPKVLIWSTIYLLFQICFYLPLPKLDLKKERSNIKIAVIKHEKNVKKDSYIGSIVY